MDGEREALELDEARAEDSVHCEGCGDTFDVAEIVESPYEADDGGAYCIECAQREWARAVEEALAERERLRATLAWYADPARYGFEGTYYGDNEPGWNVGEIEGEDRGARARAALAGTEAVGDRE